MGQRLRRQETRGRRKVTTLRAANASTVDQPRSGARFVAEGVSPRSASICSKSRAAAIEPFVRCSHTISTLCRRFRGFSDRTRHRGLTPSATILRAAARLTAIQELIWAGVHVHVHGHQVPLTFEGKGSGLFYRDDLAALIVAAMRAGPMGQNAFMALRTDGKRLRFQGIVGTPLGC